MVLTPVTRTTERTALTPPPCHVLRAQTFSADTNAHVLEAAKGDESAAAMADKQLKQTVLPFAKFKMEEAAKGGEQVCTAKTPS